MKKIPDIVLASKSARRKEILTHLGLEPKIIVSDADESIEDKLSPERFTEVLSLRKAEAVKPYVGEGQLVIASDTVVCRNGVIYGKPRDFSDAVDMLTSLSGSTHKVVSGVAVMYDGKVAVSHEVTEVTFRALSESEIIRYVQTNEPFDKAGGYGIQDKASVFVSRIDGDYYNVVGLPVFRLFSILKDDFGLDYFDLLK